MPRVTSVMCHVSIQYGDTCQSNMVTRVKLMYESQFGSHICYFDLISVPNFFKIILISCSPNLEQI